MVRERAPVFLGIMAAVVAALLVLIGVVRGNVPADARALVVALLVGSGSWGVLIWAFARATYDLENDLCDEEDAPDEQGTLAT